jgi:hypothetical protein
MHAPILATIHGRFFMTTSEGWMQSAARIADALRGIVNVCQRTDWPGLRRYPLSSKMSSCDECSEPGTGTAFRAEESAVDVLPYALYHGHFGSMALTCPPKTLPGKTGVLS